MSRNWKLFLRDTIESASKIIRYTQNRDFDGFVSDEVIYDAVLRNLEIIGEAAKKIPRDVRQQHPDIDWRGIAGLRDILAHAYFGLDDETLWDIIVNKVPRLLEVASQIDKDNP